MKYTRHQFDVLAKAWAFAKDDIELAHNLDQFDLEFVCHHNAYIAVKTFCDLGVEDVHLVSGLYLASGDKKVKHSWLSFPAVQDPVVVFEYDPNQLRKGGEYTDDKMPSWEMGDDLLISSVTIVDSARIEHPDYPHIIADKCVLNRYQPVDIDFDLPTTKLDSLYKDLIKFKRNNPERYSDCNS